MARDYTVLVTGFGANLNAPYGESRYNPAGLIARILPKSLPVDDVRNNTGASIEILDSVAGGFDSIEGKMGVIRQRTKELHAEYGGKVDLWIHLGRGPWEFVTCERLAFRQDFTAAWLTEQEHKAYYLGLDNARQTVHDLGPNPWTEVPMGLNSELHVEPIVIDANKSLSKHYEVSGESKKPLEIRTHLEAGPAGCGFIFYESMANCFQSGRKRHVLFMHVPRHLEKENLEQARDAILAVIGASVADLIKQETQPAGDWKQAFGLER